jgi:hypothetical protein
MPDRQSCPARPSVTKPLSMASILDLPADSPPVGRFRSGRLAEALPEALTAWRITTPHAEVADSTAKLLGGTARPCQSAGDGAFEVLTNTPDVDIVIDAPSAISTELKLWGRTGLTHHCDGSVHLSADSRRGSACGCPATYAERRLLAHDGHGPQVYTATRFRLANRPSIGTFLHESVSWDLAEEAAGLRAEVGRAGRPARLRLKLAHAEFVSPAGIRVERTRPVLEFIAPVAAGWPRFESNSACRTSEAARATWGTVVRLYRRLGVALGIRVQAAVHGHAARPCVMLRAHREQDGACCLMCDQGLWREGRLSVILLVWSVVPELNRRPRQRSNAPGSGTKELELPMRVHRSRHLSGFTVLPNALLQDRRLSYTARGLLIDLLSRPDGWSEDGRRMADSSPQGRHTVAKALRELAAAGYYRVDKVRREDGTFVSEAHVWDTPQQVGPGLSRPGSGFAAPEGTGSNPVKDLQKEPSLPEHRAERGHEREQQGSTELGGQEEPDSTETDPAAPADEVVTGAVATLFRVIRPEPRLRLGTVEALALAPLVGQWLDRGYGERELAQALLPGLPARIHSTVAVLRDRLLRKLPPAPQPPDAAVAVRWHECGRCADPIAQPGVCRPCAGLGERTAKVDGSAAVTARGIAMVRAAMRPVGHAPAPSRA